MWELNIENTSFKSSNGVDTVSAVFYTAADSTPRAVVQISHGMCEYGTRYRDFAHFLARHGFVVCVNDHLGHGQTSGKQGINGYFAPKDGRYFVLKDLKTMNDLARSRYPGLPVFLLGHSMGSFFARWFAVEYPQSVDGLILSGTAGPNPLVGVGIGLTWWLAKTRGPAYISPLVNRLASGGYLSRIPDANTPHDWISRDSQVIAAYAADPKCTFLFTVSAWHELFCTLRTVSSQSWANRIPEGLPVWLFAGDADPVGNYGRGVRQVLRLLHRAGVRDLRLTLYPGGRHEMLNETNRQQVYQDVLVWLNKRLEQKGTTKE